MMKTTDTRPGCYPAAAGAVRSTFRSLLPETTVGAVLVVVLDIRREQAVPTDHGFGRYHDEHRLPRRPDSVGQDLLDVPTPLLARGGNVSIGVGPAVKFIDAPRFAWTPVTPATFRPKNHIVVGTVWLGIGIQIVLSRLFVRS